MANSKNGKKSNNKEVSCGKRSGKITRKEKVAASKAAGKVPNYTPKKQGAAIERVLTGTPAEMAQVILEGSHIGLVHLQDVTFRISVEEIHGKDFTVVYLHEAKSGVLAGLSGNKTFITTGQLHAKYFKSNLAAGSTNYGFQMKMFHFLQGVFYQVGILTVSEPKKVSEQKVITAPAVEQKEKADPFEIHRKAYAKAEKVAIPMFMDEIPGEYNLFGNILRVGPHPIHNVGSYIQLMRSGGELVKIKNSIIVSFSKFVFSNPEIDNLPENVYKADSIKVLAFLREKLAKEIGFKLAEHAGLIPKVIKVKQPEAIPAESQIAVASQHNVSPNMSENTDRTKVVYGRCRGSHSTHQKV